MTLDEQVKILKRLVYQQTALLAHIVFELAHQPGISSITRNRLVEEFDKLNKIVEDHG